MTSWEAAATAASREAHAGARKRVAYASACGRTALMASWTASWAMAYIRDSVRGLFVGARQAATAARPAAAFQSSTAVVASRPLASAAFPVAAVPPTARPATATRAAQR